MSAAAEALPHARAETPFRRLAREFFSNRVATAAFAVLLTRAESAAAGRAYAAYGGVYVAASLLWLWAVEGVRPDRWDLLGAAVVLAGAAVILFGPRAT